jgi:hypothetical protein
MTREADVVRALVTMADTLVGDYVLAGYDGAAELERGLDILLTGLTTTLTPPGQTPPARGKNAAPS